MDNHNYTAEAERDREDEKERTHEAAFGAHSYTSRPVYQWAETERDGIIVSDKEVCLPTRIVIYTFHQPTYRLLLGCLRR